MLPFSIRVKIEIEHIQASGLAIMESKKKKIEYKIDTSNIIFLFYLNWSKYFLKVLKVVLKYINTQT